MNTFRGPVPANLKGCIYPIISWLTPTLLTYGSVGLVFSAGELAIFVLAVSICCAEEEELDPNDENYDGELHRTTRLDEDVEKEIQLEKEEEERKKKNEEELGGVIRGGGSRNERSGDIEMVEARDGKLDKSANVSVDDIGKLEKNGKHEKNGKKK